MAYFQKFNFSLKEAAFHTRVKHLSKLFRLSSSSASGKVDGVKLFLDHVTTTIIIIIIIIIVGQ
jgi:hypothetical protein